MLTASPPLTGSPCTIAPCRIVSTGPLVIDFYAATHYSAVSIPGATYTPGAPANAILVPGAKPIVIPIGT
jgi:hypothetical protein